MLRKSILRSSLLSPAAEMEIRLGSRSPGPGTWQDQQVQASTGGRAGSWWKTCQAILPHSHSESSGTARCPPPPRLLQEGLVLLLAALSPTLYPLSSTNSAEERHPGTQLFLENAGRGFSAALAPGPLGLSLTPACFIAR